ncbi:response regulator [Alienimonas californiensis]|uniref:histidine kinase n=1 Tax=Alienimonas californiensis TaxID=2527989 RepID=A0A517P4D1_9PLAN|nr:response regulator [Alienimonas californiensis]QDT14221.1 Aerobic respiration control sensor protein ArcB [Alienimonas californiensis]
MTDPLLTLPVARGEDVVLARQRAREVAALAGFEPQDQTRVATAVSEIARTALLNAGGGEIAFAIEPSAGGANDRPLLTARVRQTGPGRETLAGLLDGGGSGPVAARRLMDVFRIEPDGGTGAAVLMAKRLPRAAPPPTAARLAEIAAELARAAPADPLAELQRQNGELLDALAELRERQAELASLNAELEETNRGVVALYAELDEKAVFLKRASDLKSRFLSHMSHEFRSPLNSILSLVRILLDRGDGDLTDEQDKQVGFIRQSAEGLLALVNDLLDLATVEAGKTVVRPTQVVVEDLFGTLRGMFRPLLTRDAGGRSAVALHFDDPPALPALYTDEGKLAQILRNFLSNSLKFTDRGEVRVSAAAAPGDAVTFTVADTGAGIADVELERIFEEFAQIESPTQTRIRGTGLGLPLSRRLAELLGGTIAVRSAPAEGSAFSVTIPCVYRAADGGGTDAGGTAGARPRDPNRATVLVIEDDPATRYLYEKHLEGSGFEAVGAGTAAEARGALREFRPAAILLDIVLEAESGWALLEDLKREVVTRHIPVLVLTVVDDRQRAFTLGADDFRLKPIEREWLLARLTALAGPGRSGRALVIDDDDAARYVLRGLLEGAGWRVAEADRGEPGLRKAREDRPDVAFLDLVMPDLTGFQVLDRLRADEATRDLPVVICTSKELTAGERARLAESSSAILTKNPLSRDAALVRLREALEAAGVGGSRSAPPSTPHAAGGFSGVTAP